MTELPKDVSGVVERLREPHYLGDDPKARLSEPAADLISLLRSERTEAADIIEAQAEEIKRLSTDTSGNLLDDAWEKLTEKDDRTSPEEYPDMVLITREELASVIVAAPAPSRRPTTHEHHMSKLDHTALEAAKAAFIDAGGIKANPFWMAFEDGLAAYLAALDEAKAAAQADYESRIWSSIDPGDVPLTSPTVAGDTNPTVLGEDEGHRQKCLGPS